MNVGSAEVIFLKTNQVKGLQPTVSVQFSVFQPGLAGPHALRTLGASARHWFRRKILFNLSWLC
jgi:hypothetical protein